MILLVGGTGPHNGKTTIATNLAAHRAILGENVVIVDTEPEQSAFNWAKTRRTLGADIGKGNKNTFTIDAVSVCGEIEEVLMALDRHYDHVIVDAGGMDSPKLESAMLIAKKIYTPIQLDRLCPRSLWHMAEMVDKVREWVGRREAHILPNKCTPCKDENTVREAGEIVGLFNEFKVSGAPLGEYVAFKRSSCTGVGLHEMVGSNYSRWAVAELETLSREIFDI